MRIAAQTLYLHDHTEIVEKFSDSSVYGVAPYGARANDGLCRRMGITACGCAARGVAQLFIFNSADFALKQHVQVIP